MKNFIILILMATASWSLASEMSPAEASLALKELLKPQCAIAQQQVATAQSNGEMADRPQLKAAMLCQCIPMELDREYAGYRETSRLSEENMLVTLKSATTRCRARQLRQSTEQLCMIEAHDGISNKPAFCDCMQRGLQNYSDTEIADESIRVSRERAARAKAKEEGLHLPTIKMGLFDVIYDSCRRRIR
jgi:hypothetical protein